MISIEIILAEQEIRLCARAPETLRTGDFKKFLRGFFGLKNDCFFMFDGKPDVPPDMSLKEVGMHDGSGVMIGTYDTRN